jgi:hypothetical protein
MWKAIEPRSVGIAETSSYLNRSAVAAAIVAATTTIGVSAGASVPAASKVGAVSAAAKVRAAVSASAMSASATVGVSRGRNHASARSQGQHGRAHDEHMFHVGISS